MEARLVDDDDQDVPVGNSGELWVRGPNIMKWVIRCLESKGDNADRNFRGYLGKPEATRNALTPDGWYKTGDVCIVDSQGVYKIVDRKKELIKVKGVRRSACLTTGSLSLTRAFSVPSRARRAGGYLARSSQDCRYRYRRCLGGQSRNGAPKVRSFAISRAVTR